MQAQISSDCAEGLREGVEPRAPLQGSLGPACYWRWNRASGRRAVEATLTDFRKDGVEQKWPEIVTLCCTDVKLLIL